MILAIPMGDPVLANTGIPTAPATINRATAELAVVNLRAYARETHLQFLTAYPGWEPGWILLVGHVRGQGRGWRPIWPAGLTGGLVNLASVNHAALVNRPFKKRPASLIITSRLHAAVADRLGYRLSADSGAAGILST